MRWRRSERQRDDPNDTLAQASDENAAEYERIRRLRRILTGALIVLVVLLLLAFVFVLRIFQPVGKVATTAEAGGIEWVRSIYGWGNTRDQQLGAPQSVAIGRNGLVWVTDAGMARVMSFKPDGSFNSLLHQGPRGSSPEALSFPSSIAVDEDGAVYVGDMTASEVVVMTPDNEVTQRIQVPRPQSVAVRGDRLVVGSSPGFVIMTKSGEVLKVLGTEGTGDDQFSGVAGLAIAPDGTIFVVDQYNNRVSAYDTNGNRKWIRTTGKPGNQTTLQQSMESSTTEGGMQLPSGITVDGAGRLVVVDAFGFNLVVLDPTDGHWLASYGDAGVEDGNFVYPSGIAYDPARDWFAVADTSMNRVQLVRIPGSGGSPLAGVNRTLLGPVRACLVPLALLLVVLVAAFIYGRVRRRRAEGYGAEDVADEDVEAAVDTPAP